MIDELWTIEQVAAYLQVTPLTVRRYMQPDSEGTAQFREGLHWSKIGARMPRFNAALVKHWAACGLSNPELHQEAIDHHILQLKRATGKRK